MQFSMLIVPMLCNSDKTFRDVFLMHYRHCEAPSFYYQLLPFSNWYEHHDAEILMTEISYWIKSSEPSVYNSFNKILLKMAMLLEKL